MTKPITCACCRKEFPSNGQYDEVCPNCGWPTSDTFLACPNLLEGPFGQSLNRAQKAFQERGTIAPLPTDDMTESYEEFQELVETGREIEFEYNKKAFFISHDDRGYSIYDDEGKTILYFQTPQLLCEHAIVDNHLLKDIWNEVTITDIL